MSAGLGVCIAAAIHVSAALPNLYRLEHSPASFALGNSHLVQPLMLDRGSYILPTGPGLGVALDEAAIEPYRLPRDAA
jgi:galactonate dehydratase